jgi:transposase InsO family protein
MSKARVIVLSVVHQGLSKAETARRYDVSWRWVHTLVTRYHEGGWAAVEARSSRPHSSPQRISNEVRDAIVALRHELIAEGLDAGPESIAGHLANRGHHAPATSTIRRVLLGAGLIRPEPKKRPRSSLHRFVADQPNETWQGDFTHWQLSNESEVEIINWLDDHSRYLLSITAHERVSGTVVLDTFSHCINAYGVPASTLTDNGMVYTARFVGGKNAFEYLLSALGVDQKNGSPAHPQTQGKIERFHQTLKRWLRAQPACDTLEELQEQLDRFATIYNEQRPHRSLNRRTPGSVYRATPTASPRGDSLSAHYRVRLDIVTKDGKLTLRRAGRLHHLGIGIEHRRVRVIMLVDESQVTVTSLDTGEVLALNNIDPHAGYWRNQLRPPGRWPQL